MSESGRALVAHHSVLVINVFGNSEVGTTPFHLEESEDENDVVREMREGAVRSLRQIERQVLPTMPGMQYLGPEYDPAAMAYRLKFIRDGRVVFVDVDARSGAVIGQSR